MTAKRLIMALILALVLVAATTAQAGTIRLTFKDRVQVRSERILIKDLLAKIKAPSRAIADRIKRLVVDQAPEPGRTKSISLGTITSLLTADRIGDHAVLTDAPARIIVSRAALRITRERMREAFREAILDNLSWSPETVVIDSLRTPPEFTLPQGDLNIETELPPGNRISGRITVRMRFSVDDREVLVKRVSGQVKIYQKVIVAARTLARGTVLAESDLRIRRMVVKRAPEDNFSKSDKLVGMRLTKLAKAGRPIRIDQVSRAVMVKRGDRVLLVAKKGGLTVTAAGLIRDRQGSQGDQVKVLNLTTKREVYGQVVNSKTVKVFF